MVFCFVQNFFFGQHELEYLFFLSRKVLIFFPEFNIRLYNKNSGSDFVFLHQNQNIFFSNIGNQNIFLEKNHIKKSRRSAYDLFGGGFHGNNGLDPETLIHLFNTYITPVLMYGMELIIPKTTPL